MIVEMVLALAVSQGANASVARELERIGQRLAATWQKGDCSAWGAMLAPEWSVIHVTGDVITRAEALEMCTAPRTSIETFKVDDLSVRVLTGQVVQVAGGHAL